jgi:hypothetical protein
MGGAATRDRGGMDCGPSVSGWIDTGDSYSLIAPLGTVGIALGELDGRQPLWRAPS